MTWLRLDDNMLDHPKWRRALREGGDAALTVWVRLVSWCSRNLTDGIVPADMVVTVASVRSESRSIPLRALADSGLTTRSSSGDLIVTDYLERNPSRQEVLTDRSRRTESQRNRRHATVEAGTQSTSETACNAVPSRPGPARPNPKPPSEADQSLSSPPPAAVDPPPSLPTVREVFVEWQRVLAHPDAKLDAKRTAKIRKALESFTPEQLKQAIRGALKDDWLMGRDPKSPRKYDGLETLLRDNAQIERLIELERAPPSSVRRIEPHRSRDQKSDVFAYALQRISEEQAKESASP